MDRRAWFVATVVLGAGGPVYAQPPPKIKYAAPENISAAKGPEMSQAYCSVCHGLRGLGNGPAALALKKQPADLTQLTRKNNGAFPRFHVANVTQGYGATGAHGSREMPMWGTVFRSLGDDTVKLRIDNLTGYIESLQRR